MSDTQLFHFTLVSLPEREVSSVGDTFDMVMMVAIRDDDGLTIPRRPLMVRAGAAMESLLRRSCADQLSRAHSARRVSTRRPASFSPALI